MHTLPLMYLMFLGCLSLFCSHIRYFFYHLGTFVSVGSSSLREGEECILCLFQLDECVILCRYKESLLKIPKTCYRQKTQRLFIDPDNHFPAEVGCGDEE